ncbi:O-antigen ligase family protein [Halopiger aswanensis]|uniref:O-antigen ligase n=1 Tax=Halopiger aswanensis TaxID=148449 RepID=A0A419WRG9_9EURY|nr:O-antigen ligase family protein [Halopiger aswanensis]RKD98091.1 O-antigen ligase [Halopiger aswanensis]
MVDNNWISFLKNIISFEAFFFLFLFAGLYNNHEVFNVLPINMTGVMAIMTVGWAFFLWLKDEWQWTAISFLLLVSYSILSVWLTISLFWSPGGSHAIFKTFRFWSISAWAVFGFVLIIGSSEERLKRFLKVIFISSIVMTCIIFYQYPFDGPSFRFAGSNHILPGRLVGIGGLVAVYLLSQTQRRYKRILLLIIFFTKISALLIAGSRGPLVALIGAIGFWLVVLSQESMFMKLRIGQTLRDFIKTGFVAGIGTGLMLLQFPNLIEKIPGIRRSIELLKLEGIGFSLQRRLQLWSYAYDMWKESPIIGHGVGGFYAEHNAYPHNIILEILVEFGIIGLCLVTIFVLICLGRLYVSRKAISPTKKSFIISFPVYCFLAASFSLDIAGNRIFFMSVSLMCVSEGLFKK